MTHQASVQLAETLIGRAVDEAGAKAKRLGAGLGARIGEVLGICGNAWAAANMYEDLSRLSDAELQRRGIPRADLHCCVFKAVTKDA